jgi:hypothetical protein
MTLTWIQQAIVRRLAAHPFFAGLNGERKIDVIAGNDRSLLAKSDTAMAKLGLCVIVYPISGDFAAHDATIPVMRPAAFNVRVRENVITNRGPSGTGQPADYVAEVCALLLLHHRPLAEGGTALNGIGGGLLPKGIVPDDDEKGINAWNLVVHISAGIPGDPVRLDFARPGGAGLTPPP